MVRSSVDWVGCSVNMDLYGHLTDALQTDWKRQHAIVVVLS